MSITVLLSADELAALSWVAVVVTSCADNAVINAADRGLSKVREAAAKHPDRPALKCQNFVVHNTTDWSAVMTTVEAAIRDPRTCVDAHVWEREVRLIMRDHEVDRSLAERTFAQTVAYLVTSAENPDISMGPTPAVDKGVHSFVLDTPRYWDFCMRHAGVYLHHVPHLPEERAGQPKVLHTTIQAIRAAGFPLDDELWGAEDVDCHQCYACCANSPSKK